MSQASSWTWSERRWRVGLCRPEWLSLRPGRVRSACRHGEAPVLSLQLTFAVRMTEQAWLLPPHFPQPSSVGVSRGLLLAGGFAPAGCTLRRHAKCLSITARASCYPLLGLSNRVCQTWPFWGVGRVSCIQQVLPEWLICAGCWLIAMSGRKEMGAMTGWLSA